MHWVTSSYSSGNTDCVEVGLAAPGWRTSSHSDVNTNCVEVAGYGAQVGVRDSKNRPAGHLTFPAPAWAHLLSAISADIAESRAAR